MTEFFIKNILGEILFGNRICESLDDQEIVNYLYNELLLEKLLYGQPVTVPELRNLLRKKILNFEFIKLDGEIRPAKGTLMMKYVPQEQHPKGIRPSSPKVATFYDLEKKDWRSVSQRSREIVLQKDEETGKPVIMVKDKPEDGDVAVQDKGFEEKPEIEKQPDATIDGKPADEPSVEEPEVDVTNVKPIKSTDITKTFYFVNPDTGASMTMEMTPKDVIKELKKMGKGWQLSEKPIEHEDHEEVLQAAEEKEPDIINVGDRRNYLNNKGENVEIEIVREDPNGGFYAKGPNGALFKIPAGKMQNIGEPTKKSNSKTKDKEESIISKLSNISDLDNIDADELQ